MTWASEFVEHVAIEGMDMDRENPVYIFMVRFSEDKNSLWRDVVKQVKYNFSVNLFVSLVGKSIVRFHQKDMQIWIKRHHQKDVLKIYILSGDADTDFFRGRYVDRLFADGHATDGKTYREFIRPSLSDREGKVIII